MSEKFRNINNSILQGVLSSDEILTSVNELNNMSWNEEDAKYVSVFTQVYNSSYSYWYKVNNLKSTQQTSNGDTVIVADAAGALWGLIAGPVTSIIEGAVFSIIANHQVD